VAWDLRYPSPEPVDLSPGPGNAFSSDPIGPMVAPGTYTATLAQRVRGEWKELAGPVSFTAEPLGVSTLSLPDASAELAFQRRVAELERAVAGAAAAADEAGGRLRHLRQAALDTPDGAAAWVDRIDALSERLADLQVELTGDRTVARRSEPTPPSIAERIGRAAAHWTASAAATGTHRRQYEIAAEAFGPVLDGLRQLIEVDLTALEAEMEGAGAPWTPGRLPQWQPE
jgi:hypothetical protein